MRVVQTPAHKTTWFRLSRGTGAMTKGRREKKEVGQRWTIDFNLQSFLAILILNRPT